MIREVKTGEMKKCGDVHSLPDVCFCGGPLVLVKKTDDSDGFSSFVLCEKCGDMSSEFEENHEVEGTREKNTHVYPVDLAESYGFGVGFAAGTVIDLVAKHEKHESAKSLEKAAWYLARLITLRHGKEAAESALKAFCEWVNHVR